jgi:two-component system response regulator (stage 0 sporulation protein F)
MKKSIVIAEDDKDMQHLLSSLLEDEGYEVTAFDNGYTALEVIKKNIPDLVLLDIRLPGLNGMKVLEKIIAFDKSILTIMITAYVDVNDAVL